MTTILQKMQPRLDTLKIIMLKLTKILHKRILRKTYTRENYRLTSKARNIQSKIMPKIKLRYQLLKQLWRDLKLREDRDEEKQTRNLMMYKLFKICHPNSMSLRSRRRRKEFKIISDRLWGRNSRSKEGSYGSLKNSESISIYRPCFKIRVKTHDIIIT